LAASSITIPLLRKKVESKVNALLSEKESYNQEKTLKEVGGIWLSIREKKENISSNSRSSGARK
jgi:hypothetical protein